jgi:hypothetical protein
MKYKVKEDFDCSQNAINSLIGAPKEVGGIFYCKNNKDKSPRYRSPKVKNFKIRIKVQTMMNSCLKNSLKNSNRRK